MRWPKYWSFSLSISSSNEHPRLVSFRMDWLDLLAVQRTLKSLLQHHSSKASILWLSAFFRVQLSHPYMTTGKTIALTRQTFVPLCSIKIPFPPLGSGGFLLHQQDTYLNSCCCKFVKGFKWKNNKNRLCIHPSKQIFW